MSAGHLRHVRLVRVTLVAAIGEDSLMMLAEIYFNGLDFSFESVWFHRKTIFLSFGI